MIAENNILEGKLITFNDKEKITHIIVPSGTNTSDEVTAYKNRLRKSRRKVRLNEYFSENNLY